jgi:hypothetical protein
MHILTQFLTANAVTIALIFAATLLLNLLLSRKTQVDAWCEHQPRIAGVLKLLRGFGIDPWAIFQGIYLILFGRLPASYRGLVSRITNLILGAAVVLLVTGCSLFQPGLKSPCDGLYCLTVNDVLPLLCYSTKAEREAAKAQFEAKGSTVRFSK